MPRAYTPCTSIEDWNEEFSALVRGGVGQPGDLAPAPSGEAVENDVPGSDPGSDREIAERRLTITESLVRLGFLAADRATPDNPAVEVLSELLPPDAELGLCLTCHGFSSSAPYSFAGTSGVFRDFASFRMNPFGVHVRADGTPLLAASRRELVVCTQDALGWTASQVRSEEEDLVTLYSIPFRELLGAALHHRHKAVVEVWIEDGPTLSFRVIPEAAGALRSYVDQAAQAQ